MASPQRTGAKQPSTASPTMSGGASGGVGGANLDRSDFDRAVRAKGYVVRGFETREGRGDEIEIVLRLDRQESGAYREGGEPQP